MIDEIEKLKQIIQEHDTRITKLEDRLVLKKSSKQKLSANNISNNYVGINGGIQLLIENKFFNEAKSMQEIISEMKLRGYIYNRNSIDNTLKMIFLKNKTLQRIPEDTKWKYVKN